MSLLGIGTHKRLLAVRNFAKHKDSNSVVRLFEKITCFFGEYIDVILTSFTFVVGQKYLLIQ